MKIRNEIESFVKGFSKCVRDNVKNEVVDYWNWGKSYENWRKFENKCCEGK